MKEKHIKLKLSPPENREQGTENWRRSLVFNAMGWRMAEKAEQQKLIQGDELDIAFTLDYNDHPDFGGLELSLRDCKRVKAAVDGVTGVPARVLA